MFFFNIKKIQAKNGLIRLKRSNLQMKSAQNTVSQKNY
jgi:hypothetical protein